MLSCFLFYFHLLFPSPYKVEVLCSLSLSPFNVPLLPRPFDVEPSVREAFIAHIWIHCVKILRGLYLRPHPNLSSSTEQSCSHLEGRQRRTRWKDIEPSSCTAAKAKRGSRRTRATCGESVVSRRGERQKGANRRQAGK